MDAESASQARPGRRKWALTIRSQMALVVVIAVLVGWCVGIDRARRRAHGVTSRMLPVVMAAEKADPSSMEFVNTTGSGVFHPGGVHLTSVGRLKTSTKREITITFDASAGVFGGWEGRAIFEGAGRSVTWPIEDIERGRAVDLRAILPEAFR